MENKTGIEAETTAQHPIQQVQQYENKQSNEEIKAKKDDPMIGKHFDDNHEDITKLSDSACGSLNEFDQENLCDKEENRGTKPHEDSEEDSLVEIGASDSDSIDNNTFNVMYTENSESQEISELTNDDSYDKENELCPTNVGPTQKNCDESQAPVVNSEVPALPKASDNMDACGESGEDSSTSSKPFVDTTPSLIKADISDTGCLSSDISESESLSKNIKHNKSTTNRPKQFCSSSKQNKNDFTIQIFESKKPQDLSQSNTSSLNDSSSQALLESSTTDNLENSITSPQVSDKPFSSSEPLSSSPDLTTSDSLERTSSAFLDVSKAIKEESEESDALSPMQSSIADDHSALSESSKAIADTTRKISESKSSPNNSENKTTPTPPPTINCNKAPADSSADNLNVSSLTPEPKQQKHPPVATPALHNDSKPPDQINAQHNTPSAASEEVPKKPSPMAFTVELGDSGASDSSGSGSTGKKLDISGSITQWVPKHRRNLSLTKVDEHKKVEERPSGSVDKPPLGRPRSGTVGAASCMQQKKGGYHSEGYFSSDQEEDSPRKPNSAAVLKSPRSPPTPDASSLGKSLSNDAASKASTNIRKHAPKPEGRACCKERDRKPSVSDLTGKSYKQEKTNLRANSDPTKTPSSPCTDEPEPTKNEDKDDDVSEAGTYTIDKDSPSPDVEETRNDIDRVFGVPTESEAEMTSSTAVPFSTTDACQDDETSWYSASEGPKNKGTPTLSRNSPNWIHQWAAHVAEQTKPSLEPLSNSLVKSPNLTSPRGCPKSAMSPSHESNDGRPRRKLPTPPVRQASPVGRVSPNPSKSRARVEMAKNPAFRNCSFESHESGGDSDFDTSSSYPFQDDERLAVSLRNKLRLSGLESSPKKLPNPTPPSLSSPRRDDGLSAIKRDLLSKERGILGDGIYSHYGVRQEEQSDTSSDACSEPYKEPPKPIDNNPPLKFNRAFSLRRARLGCDDPAPSQSSDRRKTGRPSSAGAVTPSGRRQPLGATKGYQSIDAPSVSAARDYNCGSVVKRNASLETMDRNDGGRFSLRLARSGSMSMVSKSPSKSAMMSKKESSKKAAPRSNSTLSAKEVDFQNWKRRKNYDPMKAAAEGRKKVVERRLSKTQQPVADERSSPSPPSSLMRSASFHGTEGPPPGLRWNKKSHIQANYNSEEDGPCSIEDEQLIQASPLRRSPTSPHQLCPSPLRKTNSSIRGRRTSLEHSDEGELHHQSSSRKQLSLEESGSEGKRSPLSGVQSNGSRNSGAIGSASASGPGRPKTKMEALDNLVISTIHSLSAKVRTTSESLLQKLKSQYDEEGDRAALLDEVLSHLSESDQSMASGQTRSTSRELAGILRNLKKIEHALEVMDRVIIVGDEFYVDDDQMDCVPNEWIESDY